MIRFLALAILFLQASTAIARDSKPPNIILFVSDDHRADVLSCVGSRGHPPTSAWGVGSRGKSWPPTDIAWEVEVGSRGHPPTDGDSRCNLTPSSRRHFMQMLVSLEDPQA